MNLEQEINFPVRSFSPFYEIFNEKIQRLVEAGICPHRLVGRISFEKSVNKRFDEEIPALVLSMDDLEIGFELCLIPLMLSVAVFIFEVFYTKMKQTVKDHLLAACIILAFIKIMKPGI